MTECPTQTENTVIFTNITTHWLGFCKLDFTPLNSVNTTRTTSRRTARVYDRTMWCSDRSGLPSPPGARSPFLRKLSHDFYFDRHPHVSRGFHKPSFALNSTSIICYLFFSPCDQVQINHRLERPVLQSVVNLYLVLL